MEKEFQEAVLNAINSSSKPKKKDRKRKHQESTTMSKKILTRLTYFAMIVGLYVMAVSYSLKDLTVVDTLVDRIFQLLMVAVGFYYWKAKAENVIKFNKMKLGSPLDESGLDIGSDYDPSVEYNPEQYK